VGKSHGGLIIKVREPLYQTTENFIKRLHFSSRKHNHQGIDALMIETLLVWFSLGVVVEYWLVIRITGILL